MRKSTLYILTLWVWLSTGLATHFLGGVAPDTRLWWLLIGLPGLLVLLTLALGFAAAVIGLILGVLHSGRRRKGLITPRSRGTG